MQLLVLFLVLFTTLIMLLRSLPPGSRLRFLSNVAASLCMLVLGLPILVTAILRQKNDGGPPLTGPIPQLIGAALTLAGLYYTIRDYRAYKKSLP